MKTTVMVTSRGVITLPAKLRRALGLKADDILIAELADEPALSEELQSILQRLDAPNTKVPHVVLNFAAVSP